MSHFDLMLNQAKAKYKPDNFKRDYDYQTFFGGISHTLANTTYSFNFSNPINLLIIGIGGFVEQNFIMPYELYEISAFFESRSLDYTVTVYDISQKLLDAVLINKSMKINLKWQRQREKNQPMFEKNWQQYHKFIQLDVQEYDYSQEIIETKLPKILQAKLETKNITLIKGDIAIDKLPETYNLIICRNLLYQLTFTGQQLALKNMSLGMSKGSILWINDGIPFAPKVMNEFGVGWLDEGWRHYFGFSNPLVLDSFSENNYIPYRELLFEMQK